VQDEAPVTLLYQLTVTDTLEGWLVSESTTVEE